MKHIFTFLFLIITSLSVAFSQQASSLKKFYTADAKTTNATHNGLLVLNPDTPLDLPVTYTFTGNGDWNNPSNWENNLMPPPTTNNGSQIIIDNLVGGECLLNIPYVVTPGTSLIILSGKILRIPGNLSVN